MLVCSDSHGRNLDWHLNQVQTSHEGIGFVNAGGRASQVFQRKNITEEKLQKKDVLVIMCGSNDASKDEATEALKNIPARLEKVVPTETKVVLVDLPKKI